MLKVENRAGEERSDARNNWLSSRHQRVWVCEACERAPAVFLCKADAASLCAACDSDIHSANPLARRHRRVPILPGQGTLYDHPSSAGLVMGPDELLTEEADETVDGEDEDESASWLLLNPVKNGDGQINDSGLKLFGGEGNEYLDLDDYNDFNDQYNNQQQNCSVPQKSCGGDSVVPIQYQKGKDQVIQQHCFDLGLEYESSNTGYHYPASMSHNVSLSAMDVGVVPESTTTETSISHQRPPKGTIDLYSGSSMQMPTQLSPVDREARVLRYREKKKTRKFEKTIRYASRKAYAEVRPRIKGRFAKRTGDAEVEVDQMFSTTSLMSETAYGIVPSF